MEEGLTPGAESRRRFGEPKRENASPMGSEEGFEFAKPRRGSGEGVFMREHVTFTTGSEEYDEDHNKENKRDPRDHGTNRDTKAESGTKFKPGMYVDDDEGHDRVYEKKDHRDEPDRGQSVRTEARGPNRDEDEIMAFITHAEKATTGELIKHMYGVGFSDETIRTVDEHDINGLTWITLWEMEGAKDFIKGEMGIDIISEATYRGYIKKARKDGCNKDRLRLTNKDAPKPEEPKLTQMYTFAEWMEYQEMALTWIESNDEKWTEKVTKVLSVHGEEDPVWKNMTRMQTLIDKTWGMALVSSDTIKEIMGRYDAGREKRYQPGTKTISGIRVMKMMQRAATARTNARMETAVAKKNDIKAVSKTEDLAGIMRDFEAMKQEYEHQAGTIMSQSEETEILNRVVSKLEKDLKYLNELTIPLATARAGTDIAIKTRKAIYRFIEGLPDEKKVKKKAEEKRETVNNMEDEWTNDGARGARAWDNSIMRMSVTRPEEENVMHQEIDTNVNAEVMAVAPDRKPPARSKICLSMREKGFCTRQNCQYDHSNVATEVCQSKDYQKYGFCANWFECPCKHPYNESRYGRWGESLNKYKELAEKRMTPDTVNMSSYGRSRISG